jgi:signal transduction histidine kinase
MVEFSVHDSGIGMPADNLSHIFERLIESTGPAAEH